MSFILATTEFLHVKIQQDVVLKWLTTNELELNVIDAEDPEISDYNQLPTTALMFDRLLSNNLV